MKILQLCKKYPFPIKDGESIAIHSLAHGLWGQGCTLDLLAMNTPKHYARADATDPAQQFYRQVGVVDVDTALRPDAAFLNLFSKDSYHISRFLSAAFTEVLKDLLNREKYDVILLETLYLTPYLTTIRQHSRARVVLRAHNVECEIWERITAQTPAGPKRWYLDHLTRKLKHFEQSQLSQIDFLAPIAARDLAHFQRMGYRGAAAVTPIGLDLADYQPDWEPLRRPVGDIAFIGSLDWLPNIEGLRWFLAEVWPAARQQWPTIKLHVAGRNTPDWLRKQAPEGVVVHGEVPDARAFLNQYAISLVPLFAGSGMRAKILESMALGRVVLTTSLGLEGISATPDRDVLLANSGTEFIRQIAFCRATPTLEFIGQRARALVDSDYSSDAIARHLLDNWRSLPVLT